MHCASCSQVIEMTLAKVAGIKKITSNYASEKASIEFVDKPLSLDVINGYIRPYGYELVEISKDTLSKEAELRVKKIQVLVSLPIALIVFIYMLLGIELVPMETYNLILFILSIFFMIFLSKPYLLGVVRFVRYRVANMDTLVGIGVFTSFIFSTLILFFPSIRDSLKLPLITYFDVTIVVLSFINLGKYLESNSKQKTGEAIKKLIGLQSKTAIIEKDGKEVEVMIGLVNINDIVIVKPGTKIPVDGEIVFGTSSIDTSMITGESIPQDKAIGDKVIGGTINKQGYLKIKALKLGSESTLSQIIKLVENAENSKAPVQKFADKISSIFVPAVLIISVVSLIAWLTIAPQFMPFSSALSNGILCFVGVLVIACPCALGLATPTAIIVGVGKGATNGILIKNAESLEKLHKVDTLITDKTGTLTKGKPELTYQKTYKDNKLGLKENEILEILASLENNSEHPISKAITSYAKTNSIKLIKTTDFINLEGKGISGTINGNKYYACNTKLAEELKVEFDSKYINELTSEGKTPILLTTSNEILGIFAVSDSLKTNAKETIEELHKLGIKVILVTGDHKNTAEYISKQVGIDEVYSETHPKDKLEIIKKLQLEGKFVAMAGDGINDAPALAGSNVGISMSTGSDIAIESSDITLLDGDIGKITKAIKLSKMTMNTIKQNLFWAFVYNIIGIPLAAGLFFPIFGILLNPAFAGLAMALSSVSVVTNSLRLKIQKL